MTEQPKRPGSVSRGELDRVIRRATELQFGTPGESDEDGLTEAEVLRIGSEVGLDAGHVRRALGEVRAEALTPALPEDRGPMRRLIGHGRIRVDRVVPGNAPEVEDRLVRWLADAESLHPVRRRAGFSLWQPEEGLMAQLQRGLRLGGQRYELAQARQVELSVQGLEDGFSHVLMTIDVRNVRAEHGGGSMAGFGLLGGGVSVVAAAFLISSPVGIVGGALAGIAAGTGLGVGVGRSAFRTREERVRLAAEGILDRLERGEPLRLPGRRSR